jgi:diguanylate cyclase (GGDEF)-like protein
VSRQAKTNLYYSLVALAGLGCLVSLALRVEQWRVSEILVLLPMYVILSQLSVKLPSGLNITPVYPFAAAAMIGLGPAHTVIISVTPFLARVVINREKPLFAMYIVGQLTLTCYAASLAYQLAGGQIGVLALPGGLFAFLLFGLTFDLCNMAFVQGRLTLAKGDKFLSGWMRLFAVDRGWAMPLYHALGLLSAVLYLDRGLWGLVIAILPLFGLHAFFTLYAEISEARQLAMTDRLTGVGNYRALSEWMARNFERVVANDRPLAVLSMDVDGMKLINDTYGHEAGNAVLQGIARTLEATTRHTDIVARYGGDEFVVLLVNTTAQEAGVVRSRISDATTDLLVEYNGHRLPVSLSIGLAAYPQDAGTAEELLSASDKAMYQVKNLRRAATRGGTAAPAPAAVGQLQAAQVTTR